MDNYVLYLPQEHKGDDWGLYIPTCGYQHIFPGEAYPLPGHPATHAFNWKMGRRLTSCYIIYIATGSGEFETTSTHWKLNSGDVIILAPGEWHRYRPNKYTGWEEYWIGFSTKFLSNLILTELLPTGTSYVKHIGFTEELFFLFNKAFELTRQNGNGYKKIIAGIVMQLVAYVVSNEMEMPINREEQLSREIVYYIKKHLSEEIDFKKLASEHHLSYNRFRSIFKNRTGMSLQQWVIHERLEKAKQLIINTSLSLKEISEKTGFDSPFYFSKMFKNKIGYAPGQIRPHNVSSSKTINS